MATSYSTAFSVDTIDEVIIRKVKVVEFPEGERPQVTHGVVADVTTVEIVYVWNDARKNWYVKAVQYWAIDREGKTIAEPDAKALNSFYPWLFELITDLRPQHDIEIREI